MTHTSLTPKAGHALNQIFCYGLYTCFRQDRPDRGESFISQKCGMLYQVDLRIYTPRACTLPQLSTIYIYIYVVTDAAVRLCLQLNRDTHKLTSIA